MGWSTWNSVAYSPSAAKDEAEANALVSTGLKADGYDYVNQDDFWYGCPGSQGPDVDSYGRWATNASEFPNSGPTPGIQVLANYVHSLGLKFGLYVTPGISDQAVSENTPIEGTSYTADEIANGNSELNFNCGGMQGIDYSKPGAQAFVNSWADELASWGIDYLKIDGVGPSDTADVTAWSTALKQAGTVDDLNVRIGGEVAGTAGTAMVDDSGNSILDNVWLWRADHGAGQTGTPDQNGVGGGANGCWTCDVAQTGLTVNASHVSAYGLAVEHFEADEVIWNGQGGNVVFFQNENPYEVPSQAAWMSSPTQDGYPAFYVASNVTSFQGWGMGSYSFFDQGADIENAMAFQAPDTPGVAFHDIFTRFLNGAGGIASVINGTGAAVNSSNNGPSDVVSYP